LGFVAEPGKGDHWKFFHHLLPYPVVIDPRRPFVLKVYVENALAALDVVLARQEERNG
jgi:hypothetical protein